MFPKQIGISLIELMIVIAVLAIALSIALPDFAKLIANQQLTSASNQLLSEINYARSEAVMSKHPVVICPSPDGSQCSRGGSWHLGRLIFVDHNENRQRDGNDVTIRVGGKLDRQLSAVSSRYRPMLKYQPNGFSFGSNLSIYLCHAAVAKGRKVIVSNSGRPRVTAGNC